MSQIQVCEPIAEMSPRPSAQGLEAGSAKKGLGSAVVKGSYVPSYVPWLNIRNGQVQNIGRQGGE